MGVYGEYKKVLKELKTSQVSGNRRGTALELVGRRYHLAPGEVARVVETTKLPERAPRKRINKFMEGIYKTYL